MNDFANDPLKLYEKTANAPIKPSALSTDLESLKILVYGTCQISEIMEAAPLVGGQVSHVLWQPIHTLQSMDLTAFDLCVTGITFRSLLWDSGYQEIIFARIKTEAQAEELVERCVATLKGYLEAFSGVLSGRPVFFPSFLEPSLNYDGILINPHKPTSVRSMIRRINEKFCTLIATYADFYYVEMNDIINSIGRLYLQDDIFLSFSHNAIIRDWNLDLDKNRMIEATSRIPMYQTQYYDMSYGLLFWSHIANALKIIKKSNTVKLIIVDLDDTLWRGVAGEASELTDLEKKEGWPLGFVEALLYFKNRGGLLAICSKNDYDTAVQHMKEVWKDELTIDDFASVRINRLPKTHNIAEILGEVNVLPDSVVFIDDNPREISEVNSHFPTIRCIGGNHFEWRRIVMASPETQVPVITEESAKRTELIRAKVDRETASALVSREEWLASLQIELTAGIVQHEEAAAFARCFELLNKTNQFNTNGKRWDNGEMKAFFQTGGAIIYISLKDKTIDNGIVGLSLVRSGEIVQAVLSCRVFGLGAEIGMGHFAMRQALAQGHGHVTGTIVDTGKNFTCHRYFESMGFVQHGDHFEGQQIPDVPAWIAAHDLTQAADMAVLETPAKTQATAQQHDSPLADPTVVVPVSSVSDLLPDQDQSAVVSAHEIRKTKESRKLSFNLIAWSRKIRSSLPY